MNERNALHYKQARVCVTGWDVNRPDHFPGLGDFIGWANGLQRMPNGELLLAHSAGYWHASFASPRLFEDEIRKKYIEEGWPVDFDAPTGGKAMTARSPDNGKSWSKPRPVMDYHLDDGPNTLFTADDGTVLMFVNIQASWYGFPEAPEIYRNDINGLNTKQLVLRSTDNGLSWSRPVWIDCPGNFYERSHGQAIQLDDGGILWPAYFKTRGEEYLIGAIHRSDDTGKNWRLVSTLRRKDNHIDEPAIAKLPEGGLILVTRPDGAVFNSHDHGVSWTDSGARIIQEGTLKAPRLFVLKDGTVVCAATWNTLMIFLSTDGGDTWTHAIPLDPSSYGYPGGFMLEDESIMLSYCESGKAPNRVYIIRFRVNRRRNGVALLPIS